MNHSEQEIIRQTAGFVATALGDAWKVDTDPKYDGYPGAYLENTDGVRIYLRVNEYRHEGKVTIGTAYPEGWFRKIHTSDIEDPTIRVSRDRGPEVIAKEIERRFLPKYLPIWATITERIATHDAGDRRAAEVAERLGQVPGWRPWGQGGLSFYGPFNTRVEINWGGSLHFQDHYLDPEPGLAVAAAMADLEKQAKA